MATIITQEPIGYPGMPTGQQLVFTIANDTVVNTYFNVKFCAAVHVASTAINPASNTDLIGTFKTTPNASGVGIFDLRPVLETFLKPDQEPREFTKGLSEYKGVWYGTKEFPLHIVDKFAFSNDSIKHYAVNFYVEYSVLPLGSITSEIANPETTRQYLMTNGVIYHDEEILVVQSPTFEYGFDMSDFYLKQMGINNHQSFLTNSPTTQYAFLGDYGTFPFLNMYDRDSTHHLEQMIITYKNSSGGIIGTDIITNTVNNGGLASLGSNAWSRLAYLGIFPGNLENWSTTFASAVATGTLSYYEIKAYNNTHTADLSETYTIKLLCSPYLVSDGKPEPSYTLHYPKPKYKPVRLTWLNKWGTWDYYTFNLKSVQTINSKKIPYTQETGTWNESTYKIRGFKGGKKNFRVNSTEKIKINTNFVTEEEGVWFEELINSTEVYVLESFRADGYFSSYNTYVQPAVIATSSYTRKTIANDKLMQYTFDIEMSKMKRTQAV